MANNIKGITITLGGDTGPLTSALKDVEKTGRSLQSELKEVNKQLKFDPTNTDLLRQKQTLLAKEISNTKEKLETLKEAEKQAQEQMQNGTLGEDKYRALQREVEKTESKLKDLEQQASKSNVVLSKISEGAGKVADTAGKVSSAMAPASLAIVGIGAAAVKTGDDYEAQMSRVSAISGATGKDLKSLNDQALQLGQDTAFSASEVAEGMENLASAGFSTKEIMAAMPGMLDLAASSGEDLASSSDIAASTLRGFGLAAGDAGHVADVLAKNAAQTNAAVADTGEAMKYIAPVAQNAGWSLESVTAAIGEMADAGIKGEQAGTTLRGALTNLMNPSKEQAAAMKEIGFNAYDAQGKMKPLSQIVGELGQKTAGMTGQQRDQIVATIMGTNALSGMQVLLKDGKGHLDNLTKSLQNSDGAAKNMANTMQGNTKGSIEQMKGAIETAAIKIQQILAPAITNIAQGISNIASRFSSLSPVAQKVILVILGIVAAISPVAKVVQGVSNGIKNLIGVVQKLPSIIKSVSTVTKALFASPHALLIAAIIAAVALLVIGIKHLWDTNVGFRTAVTGIWNGIKSTVQAVGAWFSGPFVQFFRNAGNGIKAAFNGIPGFFSGIWNAIRSAATAAWNAIRSAVMAIVGPFVAAIQGPFETLRMGLTNIMNGIQAVFSGVWTIIKNVVLGIVLLFIDLITGDFNKLHSDLTGILNNIKNAFSTIWNGIKSVVTGIAQVLVGSLGTIFRGGVAVLQSIGNGLKTFFTGLWNGIKTTAVNMWNSLLSFFSSLPSRFSGFMSGVGNAIIHGFDSAITFLKNLPGQMLQWGKDMIQGLIDGIKSMIGKVGDAVRGVGDKIRSHLHFSHPDEGPLADYETWMPHMMEGLKTGILDNLYKVTDAANEVAAAIASASSGPQVKVAMAAAYGDYPMQMNRQSGKTEGPSGKGTDSGGNINVNQYFQGKVPSPAEHARKTRVELQQVVLKLRKG